MIKIKPTLLAIPVGLDTIPVRNHGKEKSRLREWANVPLKDIQIVRASTDGLIDIIYTSSHDLPSGITVNETKSGESTIDQLLIALGWQAGMPHNEHIAVLSSGAASNH